ncbi:MAG: hypothetical protein P1P79_03045, partial [Lutibacter sp.]|nr:hypothetical protein [Lutibacter sp.]
GKQSGQSVAEAPVPINEAVIKNSSGNSDIDFSLYWRVWDLLKEKYVDADKLDAKKDNVKEKAKAEYKELMTDLKSKKADLQAKYKKLENATEDKWGDVKKTFSNAADSFEEGFSKIGSLFK